MIDPKKLNKSPVRFMNRCRKGSAIWGRRGEKIRQVLQSQLTRTDTVSREEFDVQTQVLLRTRESWRCWSSVLTIWKAVR